MKKSKKKITILLTILLCVILVIFGTMFIGKQQREALIRQQYSIVSPINEDLIITSVASGKIKSSDVDNYGFSGVIEELKVNVGDYVKKGDVLGYYLDNRYSKRAIESEMNGIVTMIPSNGYNVIQVSNPNNLEVDVQITEKEIYKIKENQQASIYVEAIDKTLKGNVKKINKVGNAQMDFTLYTVTIKLEEFDDNISLGMTASVKIETNRVEDALVVDYDCLIEKDDKYYVLLSDWLNNVGLEKEKYYKEVEIGLANINYVEIKSGLTTSDEVLVIPTTPEFFMPFSRFER